MKEGRKERKEGRKGQEKRGSEGNGREKKGTNEKEGKGRKVTFLSGRGEEDEEEGKKANGG
jgi:hypothetical protein